MGSAAGPCHLIVLRVAHQAKDPDQMHQGPPPDDFNREAPAIASDFPLPPQRVIRALRQLILWRGKPQQNAYIERFNGTVR